MLDLTLAKPIYDVRVELVAAPMRGGFVPGWLLRIWQAAARHAERPGRFVPYC